MANRVLITGAGGFIGGHLVRDRLERGDLVTAVDIKDIGDWYQVHDGVDNRPLSDASSEAVAQSVTEGCQTVFNLAADMGGMGFIENNKALCMLSVLINTQLLVAAREHGAERFFFASSACVYNASKQRDPEVTALREDDAYPADPEDGYGWEKLFSERMSRHFREDFGIETRIARFHNVYGPWGTYTGGREKAPAAICRKVIEAKLSGRREIEIWGDGNQTRSFMWIEDCLRGIRDVTEGDYADPVNLGSAELVSIDDLVNMVEHISGITLTRKYVLDAPQGVRGRNSDNTLFRSVYGWEPSTPLKDGLEQLYAWIYDDMTSDRPQSR